MEQKEKSKIIVLVYENQNHFQLNLVEVENEKLNRIADVDVILDIFWDEHINENQSVLAYSEKFKSWIEIVNHHFCDQKVIEFDKWVKKIHNAVSSCRDIDSLIQICMDVKNSVPSQSNKSSETTRFLKLTSELILDNGSNLANAYRYNCPEKGCAILMVMKEMKPNKQQGTKLRFISRTFTPEIFDVLPQHVQNSIENCKPGTFYMVFMDTEKQLVSGFFVSLNTGKVINN